MIDDYAVDEQLRNDQQLDHHWLRVKLEGSSANRSAIGAVVEVTAGGQTQRGLRIHEQMHPQLIIIS